MILSVSIPDPISVFEQELNCPRQSRGQCSPKLADTYTPARRSGGALTPIGGGSSIGIHKRARGSPRCKACPHTMYTTFNLVAPCCGKVVACKTCHDSQWQHALDRSKVTHMACRKCRLVQPASNSCARCGSCAPYYCSRCSIWSNHPRIHHCDTCDQCLEGAAHRCVDHHEKCPVCLEELRQSHAVKQVYTPPCAHLIHTECMKGMLVHGKFGCPQCRKSMVDTTAADRALAMCRPAGSFGDLVTIYCNDCETDCRSLYHPYGVQCTQCKGFNTALK